MAKDPIGPKCKVRLNRRSAPGNRPARPRPVYLRRAPGSGRAGFVLVAVIWSLGLITLLGTAVIVGSRYRAKLMSSSSSVTAATVTAESAINLGIIAVLTTASNHDLKEFPLRCRMPGGESVVVTLEQESGKIDLNKATPAVLFRLFSAMTLDRSLATQIVSQITEIRQGSDLGKARDFRGKATKPDNPGKGDFTTIMQLEQVEGISPRLFRIAQRYVTVHSGRPEPIAEAASPALRAALELDRKPTETTRTAPTSGNVTIRADVLTLDGTRFIREALISLGESGRPFLIREWRHGDIDSALVPARYRQDMPVTDCLRVG